MHCWEEREGGRRGVKIQLRYASLNFDTTTPASLSAKNVSENERENPSEHRPSHEEVALDRRDHVVLDSPQLAAWQLVSGTRNSDWLSSRVVREY